MSSLVGDSHRHHQLVSCVSGTCREQGEYRRSTELVGYARASIYEKPQVLAKQVESLKTAGCVRIFEDRCTGASMERPGLRACLGHLQCDDVLVVLDLDRFGLLTGDMVRFVKDLENRGVGFQALNADFDTKTSAGRSFMETYAAFAEMDCSVVRQRINEGSL